MPGGSGFGFLIVMNHEPVGVLRLSALFLQGLLRV